MITAEVALYPLKTNNATDVINESINTLDGSGVEYSVNSMNTHITGTKEDVFSSLEKMFEEAKENGEVSMVVTVSNSTN